jgi:hypothetical protein
MAEIVNLRRVRKEKRRQTAAAAAEANRAKHGLTKAEKRVQTLEKGRLEKQRDHSRLAPKS